MKRCPKCNSQYSDATLNFCLQDGASLVTLHQSSIDTVSFRQPVTAEKLFNTQEFLPGTELTAQIAAPAQKEKPLPVERQKSRAGIIAGFVIVPMLLLLTAGVAGGWWYLSAQRNMAEKSSLIPAANLSPES